MRNGSHQVMELSLDRRQIGKNVGVIVFEVVEDHGTRPVVHELGTLVAECGVVLVGLDDEKRTVGHARGNTEVDRHTSDQEPGIHAGVVENPGEQRGRGRLAVRSRDREHPLVA